MSYGSSISKLSTLNVLRSEGISKIKQFTFDGHVFSPDILRHMANEIDCGALDVAYETKNMGDKAIYNSTENRLYVGFWHAGTLPRKAILVHELTHAVMDFQARKMDIATSEAIAYIAQCQYARANNDDPDPESRLYHDQRKWESDAVAEKKDNVFIEAWRIAGKILDGGSVDSNDVRDMKAAITAHPEYATDASSSAGFNGY